MSSARASPYSCVDTTACRQCLHRPRHPVQAAMARKHAADAAMRTRLFCRFCCACRCIQSAYRHWAECWLPFGLLAHVVQYTWIWCALGNRGSVALVRQHLVPALSFSLSTYGLCVGCFSSGIHERSCIMRASAGGEIMWSTLVGGLLCCRTKGAELFLYCLSTKSSRDMCDLGF